MSLIQILIIHKVYVHNLTYSSDEIKSGKINKNLSNTTFLKKFSHHEFQKCQITYSIYIFWTYTSVYIYSVTINYNYDRFSGSLAPLPPSLSLALE